jgi:hypothetical protein
MMKDARRRLAQDAQAGVFALGAAVAATPEPDEGDETSR